MTSRETVAPGWSIGSAITIHDKATREPDVCALPNGQFMLAWIQGNGQNDTLYIGNTLDFQHPIEVAGDGLFLHPTITADDAGVAVVHWVSFEHGQWTLNRSTYDGTSISPAQRLASSEQGLFRPHSMVASDGVRYTSYEAVEDGHSKLFVRAEGPDRSLRTSQVGGSGECFRARIVSGKANAVWLTYDEYVDSTYRVMLQRIDTIGAPLVAVEDGFQNLQPDAVSDSAGNVWIAWVSNRNDAARDKWWLTKWTYLRRFDGSAFFDPIGHRPGVDVYNEDSFQGWEFPSVSVDAQDRIWIFGQSSHTRYAQVYGADGWSDLLNIDQRHWGCWKPRSRVAAGESLCVASMGLDGAQFQLLETSTAGGDSRPPSVQPVGRPEAAVHKSDPRRNETVKVGGETLNYYFGDLHAHSVHTDATNDVDEFYHRYRDAYGYDFAALTDHDYLDGIELSRAELELIWSHADRMSTDGRFIALHGYEWTSPAIADHAAAGARVGEGHRHIIYPDRRGPLVSYGDPDADTGAKLLERLRGVRALVIPHHTAWSGTDWDAHDDELQRLVEVCSTHGRFEFAGNRPIGYRRDHLHPHRFVEDGLARGYRLGFTGGSDSHGLRWHATELEGRARHIPPGTHVGWKEDAFRTGMTVVLAPELTREDLFDALYRRRCYATSGVRIVLDFRVNGWLMGSDISTADQPLIAVEVKGTGGIRSIEIVSSGHVVSGIDVRPGEAVDHMSFSYTDRLLIPGEERYYYARVVQEDGNMAWSSPVWVRYAEAA